MIEQFELDNFEPILISGIISDPSVLSTLSPFLSKPQEIFKNTNFVLTVNFYKYFFDKIGKLPTKDEVSLFLKKEEHKISVLNAIESVNNIDFGDMDRDLFYKSAERFIKERGIWNTMISVAKNMDEGSITSTEILSKFEDICTISLNNDTGLDLYEDIDFIVSKLKEKRRILSTGYRYIDMNIDGGLDADGRVLYMFMAPPNKGKSLFLGNVACNIADQDKTVLLISLEMSEIAYAKRFCSQQSSIPYGELHDRAEEIKGKLTNKLGKIIIKEFPPSSLTVPQLRAWIKNHLIDKGIKIDAIVIDYLNLLDGPGNNLYEKIKSITEQVRALSYWFSVPLVSATQQNRCLAEDTVLKKDDGTNIQIKDIKVGDIIQGNNKLVTVTHKFEPTIQKVYKIITKSGKEIKCSANHMFPTSKGEKSINTGLLTGDSLFISVKQKNDYNYFLENTLTMIIEEEIIIVKEIGDELTYDISVSDDHLFLANDILTHNSATGKEMCGLSTVSESSGISATADVLWEIFQNEEDSVTNIFRVGFAKNRYGPVNFSVITKIDFKTLKIFDMETESSYTGTNIASIEEDLNSFLSIPS